MARQKLRISLNFLVLISLVIIADQAIKYWAVQTLFRPNRTIEVLFFFNLVPVWNPGISFGLLSDYPDFVPILITLVTVIITLFLIAWLFSSRRLLQKIGLSLIIGGAIGNIIDRINYGAVVDFVDIHIAGLHWPAFNLADSAITVGVCFFLFDNFVLKD